MFRPRTAWWWGPAGPLLLVLLLMLGLSGFLAFQAWTAARSHRHVTEAALRDYAGFAAWELRRRVEARVTTVLNASLVPARVPFVLRRGAPGPVPEMEMTGFVVGVEAALLSCGCPDAASDFFSLDLETRRLELRHATLGSAFEAWLRNDFPGRVRATAEASPPEPVIRSQTGGRSMVVIQRMPMLERAFWTEAPPGVDPSRVVVYTAGRRGDSQHVFGFVVDVPALLGPVLASAFASPGLLPLSLIGSARNEDVLSVNVVSAQGDSVFAVGEKVGGGAEAVDTFRLATGPLVARVAVRPEVAGRLVIGGTPGSRVPLLLGSVGLTLVLMLVAVAQLRRQQELVRLRADFVSGVSHELRTPLAQIRLFSDLLASERLEEEQRRRSLRILSEETQRLTYLVENVLRFSRSERSMDRVSPRLAEVRPLLQAIVDDFAPLARVRDARIRLDVPPALAAPLDADAMRQVLLNLLDNAVKYGPRGQRIEARARAEGGWLRVEVEDAGPGIPAADRERIWEPYRRLAREAEAATGGSGIGLAVVRDLVALHGGRATVEPASPRGSRFILLLPGARQLTVDSSGTTDEVTRKARV